MAESENLKEEEIREETQEELNEEGKPEDVKEASFEEAEVNASTEEPGTETPEDTAPEDGETAGEPEGDGKEKTERRFFKKKDKKKDPKDEKIAELTDRLQRLMAEFDNYRKRTEKEKAAMYDMGTSATLEKFLPVLDNFERGLASVDDAGKESSVYVGMDMIYKQLVKVMTDMGVEPIDAAGKEFDPNLHNAVMQTESEELPENTVAVELQKGYTYKGSVLRHSMVSVVK
ncbi:MAG: nucleotide exchange factor GrpE [Lachnospiraceae bacterium]|nr:nucleotide exchange factor GrpE [Lachnospiraceae bacterium]